MRLQIPAALAGRPVHARRQVPIPWMNEHTGPDGFVRVDFSLVSDSRCVDSAQLGLCGVCGTELDHELAFLGGPHATELRIYGDPPMHEACAVASLHLCPHLALQRHHRPPQARGRSGAGCGSSWPTMCKPQCWLLGITTDFALLRLRGVPVFAAAPFTRERTFSYDAHGRIHELV